MLEKNKTKNRLIDSKPIVALRVALGAAAVFGMSHEATKIMGFNPFEVGPAAISQTLAPEHISPMDRAITTGEQQVTVYADQIKTGSSTADSTEQLAPISQSPAYQATVQSFKK
jgi:hypothetical protein